MLAGDAVSYHFSFLVLPGDYQVTSSTCIYLSEVKLKMNKPISFANK